MNELKFDIDKFIKLQKSLNVNDYLKKLDDIFYKNNPFMNKYSFIKTIWGVVNSTTRRYFDKLLLLGIISVAINMHIGEGNSKYERTSKMKIGVDMLELSGAKPMFDFAFKEKGITFKKDIDRCFFFFSPNTYKELNAMKERYLEKQFTKEEVNKLWFESIHLYNYDDFYKCLKKFETERKVKIGKKNKTYNLCQIDEF